MRRHKAGNSDERVGDLEMKFSTRGREEMERREDENKGIIRLGLIYSVEHQRFDIVYKDLRSNQIRIGSSEDQEDEERPPSISAA